MSRAILPLRRSGNYTRVDGVITVMAIDVGSINTAIMITEIDHTRTKREVLYFNLVDFSEMGKLLKAPRGMGSISGALYQAAVNHITGLGNIYSVTHVLVEGQLSQNTVCKVLAETITCSASTAWPDAWVFTVPASFKMMFSEEKFKTHRERKKYAVETAEKFLSELYDPIVLSSWRSHAKRDDLSDVLCYTEAFVKTFPFKYV